MTMIELTPADLPEAIASMSTGAGITEAEMRDILADCNQGQAIIERDDGAIWVRKPVALAAMRAVEARTRQATPAPDAVAEAVEAIRPFAEFGADNTGDDGWNNVGLSTCKDRVVDWFGPSDFRRAAAFIATHTTQKTGEG